MGASLLLPHEGTQSCNRKIYLEGQGDSVSRSVRGTTGDSVAYGGLLGYKYTYPEGPSTQ